MSHTPASPTPAPTPSARTPHTTGDPLQILLGRVALVVACVFVIWLLNTIGDSLSTATLPERMGETDWKAVFRQAFRIGATCVILLICWNIGIAKGLWGQVPLLGENSGVSIGRVLTVVFLGFFTVALVLAWKTGWMGPNRGSERMRVYTLPPQPTTTPPEPIPATVTSLTTPWIATNAYGLRVVQFMTNFLITPQTKSDAVKVVVRSNGGGNADARDITWGGDTLTSSNLIVFLNDVEIPSGYSPNRTLEVACYQFQARHSNVVIWLAVGKK